MSSAMRLTHVEHDELWAIFDKSKDGTKSLIVPRTALMNLLMDHQTLHGERVDSYHHVKEDGAK